jgi:succinylarginine dihydrolase
MAIEANFDGLIGPTHNYAGLAYGNVASATNKGAVSSPKAAALQGLQKMKFLADLGIPQGILPPQPRPRLDVLRSLGFAGDDAEVIRTAHEAAPHLLAQCYSASSMWVANAATISPSADTADGRVHLTPANLLTSFHRSIEAGQTTRILRQIFAASEHFVVHDPLPAQSDYADEGAANILRLARTHGDEGLEIHVYGRDNANPDAAPKRFPARQTKQASDAIFRRAGVKNALLLQQHPAAIDAGVFHNDVISVANESVLLAHELTFADPTAFKQIRARTGDWFTLILIRTQDVPLEDAVKSYLFNTQIVRLSDGSMAIIAPKECEETPSVHAALTRIREANDNPISAVHYLDVRESMRNGGGPACLRLRVALTPQEYAATHNGIWLTDARYDALVSWVETHYRDALSPDDLGDPLLAVEVKRAMEALEPILQLRIL